MSRGGGVLTTRGLHHGLLVGLVVSGCGVDLLVGGAETTSGASTETGPSAEGVTSLVSTTASAESTTGPRPGTSSDSTTSAVEGSSTEAVEGSSTTEPPAEGSTTGDVPCEGQNAGPCNELEHCLWFPDPEECVPNPCTLDPPHECFGVMEFEPCVLEPDCAWAGEMAKGECGPVPCIPCEFLEGKQCEGNPACTIEEMSCVEAPI